MRVSVGNRNFCTDAGRTRRQLKPGQGGGFFGAKSGFFGAKIPGDYYNLFVSSNFCMLETKWIKIEEKSLLKKYLNQRKKQQIEACIFVFKKVHGNHIYLKIF